MIHARTYLQLIRDKIERAEHFSKEQALEIVNMYLTYVTYVRRQIEQNLHAIYDLAINGSHPWDHLTDYTGLNWYASQMKNCIKYIKEISGSAKESRWEFRLYNTDSLWYCQYKEEEN